MPEVFGNVVILFFQSFGNSPLQKNRNSPFFKGGGREADGGFLPSQRDVVENTDEELNGG
jgi:hypothetical protein